MIGDYTGFGLGGVDFKNTHSCVCAYCIHRFVSCFLATIGTFNVVSRNTLWIWLWIPYSNGRDQRGHVFTLLHWFTFSQPDTSMVPTNFFYLQYNSADSSFSMFLYMLKLGRDVHKGEYYFWTKLIFWCRNGLKDGLKKLLWWG